MANERWHAIAEQIRTADANLNIGERICKSAEELLGSVGTSLALVVNNAYSPISASNAVANLLDEEQFALGNGPTFDARQSESPVIASELGSQHSNQRWPAFGPVARKHNIQAVFAFPLRIGNAYLGVMTAYFSNAGEPTVKQYSDGLILASLATAELLLNQAGVTTPELSDVFEPGLYSQSSLQLASGMVAESINCSIVEALVRIRARAFADDKPVTEIARQIVANEIKLED